MFKELKRIADALEGLLAEYKEQNKRQQQYVERAAKAQESMSIDKVFNMVNGLLTRTPETRGQINNGN